MSGQNIDLNVLKEMFRDLGLSRMQVREGDFELVMERGPLGGNEPGADGALSGMGAEDFGAVTRTGGAGSSSGFDAATGASLENKAGFGAVGTGKSGSGFGGTPGPWAAAQAGSTGFGGAGSLLSSLQAAQRRNPGGPESAAQGSGADPAGFGSGDGSASLTIGPGEKAIESPIAGLFHEAEAPGAEPYVKEGQSIHAGDVVCTLEAMKMFNDVKSTADGVVEKILVHEGDTVKAGQALFVVKE